MKNTMNEFEGCACFNVRKVSRQLSQLYDHALEPSGLKNTQFTMLAVASEAGPISITDLSQLLDLDRTTLTRNLRIMEREGFIVVGSGKDARSKTVTLSAKGRSRLKQATPLWRNAQAKILKRFGRDRWDSLRIELQYMRDVAAA
jgi:DNA-binding MarR family transcriptional regulator